MDSSRVTLFSKILVFATCVALAYVVLAFFEAKEIESRTQMNVATPPAYTLRTTMFSVQSVDTMKQSRDQARKMLKDKNADMEIDVIMSKVAQIGATHVAISTPYDEEFLPVLTKWVASARKYNLHVWFRGNFAGWEGWFEYKKISDNEHKTKLADFILKNKSLFQDGDLFMPCPECENGSGGDPRKTGAVAKYQKFLSDEYTIANDAFTQLGVHVSVYSSMNADVAKLTMNQNIVSKIGGTVLLDHYTKTSDQFAYDIENIYTKIGAPVGVGEFGAPIPDLNGFMSESEQGAFVEKLMHALWQKDYMVSIVNYWDIEDGSTALLNKENHSERKAYTSVQNYFTAPYVYGRVYDAKGNLLSGVHFTVFKEGDESTSYSYVNNSNGTFQIFLPKPYRTIRITKDGFRETLITLPEDMISTEKIIELQSL